MPSSSGHHAKHTSHQDATDASAFAASRREPHPHATGTSPLSCRALRGLLEDSRARSLPSSSGHHTKHTSHEDATDASAFAASRREPHRRATGTSPRTCRALRGLLEDSRPRSMPSSSGHGGHAQAARRGRALVARWPVPKAARRGRARSPSTCAAQITITPSRMRPAGSWGAASTSTARSRTEATRGTARPLASRATRTSTVTEHVRPADHDHVFANAPGSRGAASTSTSRSRTGRRRAR
jgi:hypothetical protein